MQPQYILEKNWNCLGHHAQEIVKSIAKIGYRKMLIEFQRNPFLSKENEVVKSIEPSKERSREANEKIRERILRVSEKKKKETVSLSLLSIITIIFSK